MDHLKILKRAFAITLNYRVLWVFGIILALTTGASGSGDPNPRMEVGNDAGGGAPGPGPGWPGHLSQEVITALIAVGVALLCLIILLVVVGTIARYVAETSVVKLVDRYEASGEQLSLREGFRIGWSRTALRLFLMDLLVGVPFFLAFLLLLLVAAAPLLVWLTESQGLRVIGTLATIGLAMFVIFLTVLVGVALGVLQNFFRRACVLEDLGVVDAVRRGWDVVRQRPGDVALMALILFTIGLAFTILTLPLALLLMVAAAVIVGLPALLVGSVVALFAGPPAGIIVGVVAGLPLFILILAAPLAFLGGLWQVFNSSAWTLSYRELLALESVKL